MVGLLQPGIAVSAVSAAARGVGARCVWALRCVCDPMALICALRGGRAQTCGRGAGARWVASACWRWCAEVCGSGVALALPCALWGDCQWALPHVWARKPARSGPHPGCACWRGCWRSCADVFGPGDFPPCPARSEAMIASGCCHMSGRGSPLGPGHTRFAPAGADVGAGARMCLALGIFRPALRALEHGRARFCGLGAEARCVWAAPARGCGVDTGVQRCLAPRSYLALLCALWRRSGRGAGDCWSGVLPALPRCSRAWRWR